MEPSSSTQPKQRRRRKGWCLVGGIVLLVVAGRLLGVWPFSTDPPESDSNTPGREVSDAPKPQPASHPAEEYFPIGVGHRWVYDVKVDMPLLGTTQGTSTTTINEIVTIDGKRYSKAVVQPAGFISNPQQLHYYRRSGNTFYRVFGDEPDLGEMVFWKMPLEVGKRWTAKTADGQLTYEVEAKQAVTCWNGKKYEDCYRVRMKGEVGSTSFDDTLWLAPKVGLVKREGKKTFVSFRISLREFR